MKNLLLLACMALYMHGMSQNAFYDAKKIAAWAKQPGKNNQPGSATYTYNDTIAGIILKYSTDHGWDNLLTSSKLTAYADLYKMYLTTTGILGKVDTLARNLLSHYPTLPATTQQKLHIYYNRITKLEKQKAKAETKFKSFADLSAPNTSKEKNLITILSADSLNRLIQMATIQYPSTMKTQVALDAEQQIQSNFFQAYKNSFTARILVPSDTSSVEKSRNILLQVIDTASYKKQLQQAITGIEEGLQKQYRSRFIDSLYSVKLNELQEEPTLLSGRLISARNQFAEYFSGEDLTADEKQKIIQLGSVADNTPELRNNLSLTLSQSKQQESDDSRENHIAQSSSLANFKLPGEAELIDALAVYLTKRFKQEGIIYFTNELREKFDSIPMVHELFRNTNTLLNNWDNITPPRFGTEWKYAFSKDLSHLPGEILRYAGTRGWLQNEAGLVFADVLQFTNRIQSKYNFIEIIQSLKDTSLIRSQSIRAFTLLTDIINNELFDTVANRNYWIRFQDFESGILRNRETCKLFMSLLLQKYPYLGDILGITAADINTFNAKVKKAADWISNVLIALDHFQRNQNAHFENSSQNYIPISYWTLFSDIMKQVLNNKIIAPTWLHGSNTIASLERVDTLFEIYTLIENRNYAGAAQGSVSMLNSIAQSSPSFSATEKKAIDFIKRVLNLMVDVSKAQNSQQLAEVIEANALPPSSYRYRFKYKNSIDIGAYIGAYAGMELVQNTGTSKQYSQPGFVYGLTAPIGINFNRRNTKGNYTTVSLSLIDIGAVVSYRLSNDAEAPLPNTISWSQVLSPGLYYRPKWGLKKTPLVWSIGAQYAPKLRVLNGVNENNTIRFSIGAALDMPLLVLRRKE